MSYLSEVLADTPALFWRLGESSGTTAADASGNGRSGEYRNSPTVGKVGALAGSTSKAIEVNGTTQGVRSTSYTPFVAGSVRTFEGWAWRDVSTAEHTLVGSNNPGSEPCLIIASGSQDVRWSADSASGTFATWTAAWPGNAQWVHWVVVFDEAANQASLYINGNLVSTKEHAVNYNTPGTLVLGYRNGGSAFFDGRLDEFAVYEKALSAARVKVHYDVGLTGTVIDGAGFSSGTGSGTAGGERTRYGGGGGTGTGSGSGSGSRERLGAGTGTGSGTATASGEVVSSERNRVRVVERPPMRQAIRVISPDGVAIDRWAEDAPAGQSFDDLSDSGSVPGGDKDCTVTLARKPGVNYGDMKRGSRMQIFGAGSKVLSEYRLERAPEVSGDHLSVSPAAAGLESLLVDDNTAQEIFIDAEIGAWGEVSAKRRADNPSLKFDNAQVQVVPAGTPDPANLASFSRAPAISHSWTTIDNNGGANPDVAESWYFSPVELGKLMLDWSIVAGISPGDTNWANQVNASDEGIEPIELLAELNATNATAKTVDVPAGRYALMLRDFYGVGIEPTPGKWEAHWKNLRVFGRHDLPVYGSWPAVGLLASDVVAYALRRWAPQIDFTTGSYGTIKPTRFIIPHLTFAEPTTVAEMINQATRFELPEWGVWAGHNGPTFYMNPRGQREGAKRWRVRSSEIQFEDTGQQLDKVFNGVVVVGQGTDGSTLYVGPAGSGLRYTSDRLLDADPQNPANEAGIKRYAKIQMKGIATMEGMVEAGEAFLEQCKLLDGSGKATLTGYVEDSHGKRWPYYCIKEGHEVEILGSSIPGSRYIVSANRSRASRSVEIDIDAPPDGYEAILERLYAEYVGIALESA